ncbi:uncharacterized protein LOC129238767 [Anastrepha obliqua]|uniref:uncharacterized protein LOC129238767 n=1 Tax=Anastrepha obliqua TaxID=95512 RepID=UPI002409EE2E|nr:uncharacterized protein LOC129238767 [Anastrepha obliqua]
METITLDMSIFKSEVEQFGLMVRTSLAKVYFVGAEYGKWLSKFLLNKDSGIRLIHYPIKRPVKPINSRMLRPPYISKKGTNSDPICLMLTNLSSAEEISARLRRSLDPLMFYGSFHLKMDVHHPFTEEFSKWVKIGDKVIFRVITDEKTANHNPDGDLANTLKKNFLSTAFVVYLGLRAVGTIEKGAVIYVPDN